MCQYFGQLGLKQVRASIDSKNPAHNVTVCITITLFLTYLTHPLSKISGYATATHSPQFTQLTSGITTHRHTHTVVKVDRRIRWHYTTTILRLRIGARLTLMASAGTPYRLVPAHFYPCTHTLTDRHDRLLDTVGNSEQPFTYVI